MDKKVGDLDHWRCYFRTASSDIFEVIEYAILVAASDFPQELLVHRSRIAEVLFFSSRMTRCLRCDHIEVRVPHRCEEEDEENGEFKGSCGGEVGGKESKVNSSTNERGEVNGVINYGYEEAEALTEEIEVEGLVVQEVLRIKGVLDNPKDKSEDVLFEYLRRLQSMKLTVEALKATEIGKVVNGLRKHGLKQIRHLAKALIVGWKDVVDEWVNSVAAISGSTPESVNPSVVDDEEGLPSPPLDEGALLTTQTMELSQFFDGMDDDGNPRNNGESNNKLCKNGRGPGSENSNYKRKKQDQNMSNESQDVESERRKQGSAAKPSKQSLGGDLGPHRPPMLTSDGPPLLISDHETAGDSRSLLRSEQQRVQNKPLAGQNEKSPCSDDSVRLKLEASGRNLQQRYLQLENAKKQRTIQVMELHDLPKGNGLRNDHFKSGMPNRHWANSRR